MFEGGDGGGGFVGGEDGGVDVFLALFAAFGGGGDVGGLGGFGELGEFLGEGEFGGEDGGGEFEEMLVLFFVVGVEVLEVEFFALRGRPSLQHGFRSQIL